MRSATSLQNLNLKNSIVTIGTFDGVHAGHQAIISSVVEEARQGGSPSVVVTFFPHPAVVFGKISTPYYLTSPEERTDLLRGLGIQEVVTLKFDLQMAALLPEVFISNLNDHLGISQLWVGYDFALGRNRVGDHARLEEIGRQMGFSVRTLEPVAMRGQKISSSLIRTELTRGNITDANRMLGRRYSITGRVVKGDGRGKSLGFPTANLAIWKEQLLPINGIYSGWTLVNGSRYLSVANLGIRPTFENNSVESQLEIHILDFDQNLYGESVTFEFDGLLRPEKKYASIPNLIAQIEKDIEKTRQELKDAKEAPGIPARPAKAKP